MTALLIVYGTMTVAVAIVATVIYLIEAGEYGDPDAERKAARIALTCYAWPLHAARFLLGMITAARREDQ